MIVKTQSLHISLPAKMRQYVQQQSKQQNYSAVSDFIQFIIREDMKKREQVKLEKMLLEGLASGSIPYNKKTWAKTRKRILAKI